MISIKHVTFIITSKHLGFLKYVSDKVFGVIKGPKTMEIRVFNGKGELPLVMSIEVKLFLYLGNKIYLIKLELAIITNVLCNNQFIFISVYRLVNYNRQFFLIFRYHNPVDN